MIASCINSDSIDYDPEKHGPPPPPKLLDGSPVWNPVHGHESDSEASGSSSDDDEEEEEEEEEGTYEGLPFCNGFDVCLVLRSVRQCYIHNIDRDTQAICVQIDIATVIHTRGVIYS